MIAEFSLFGFALLDPWFLLSAPLFMAAERGDETTVGLLLSAGAGAMRTNWNGMTPFMMAPSVRP